MDYCSSCRRHLNGALVCPGCGAYAPDIAPHAAEGRGKSAPTMTSAAPATTAHWDTATYDTWHDTLLDGEAESSAAMDVAPHVAADVEDLPPARQGRAARRRQLVRWKKNKRRAAVASAVALVGGGLTITMMDRNSADQAETATAPDDRSVSALEEQTPEENRPASASATAQRTHRSSHDPSQPQPPTENPPRQQSLASSPLTTPTIDRPEAAAPHSLAATPTPQPRSTTPSADDTVPDPSDTTAQQPSTPAPTNGTDSGTSQTRPARASTSPTDVCLLGLCLS
ncbi:SCO2400 family protein [Streptomyces yanii]|uniref:Zinc ribbon domain-containing protein n=1 Tax=Streptomyces yanii TaxID=78510 RepID=A0ABV5RMK7_9ACTN